MAKGPKKPASSPAAEATYDRVQRDLSVLLAPVLPGAAVKVEHSARWKRMQVTVTWQGFADLLAEERFRLVVEAVPKEFFEAHLKSAVWFELAPGERDEDLLKLPRSEDVADDEVKIITRLIAIRFFEKLAEQSGPDPTKSCAGGLQISKELLRKLGKDGKEVDRACLAFIRHHAFCDCQVLQRAQPEMEAMVAAKPAKPVAGGRARAPRRGRG